MMGLRAAPRCPVPCGSSKFVNERHRSPPKAVPPTGNRNRPYEQSFKGRGGNLVIGSKVSVLKPFTASSLLVAVELSAAPTHP